MRRRTAAIGAAALTVALVPVLAPPGQAASSSLTLRPVADAWYATSPACAQLPLGCGSAPTTTAYPPGTLHVGATGGQEAARAYLSFEVPDLPTGLAASQLVLPVDPDAGSNAAESAAVTVCVVPGGLSSPAPQTAPAVDCTTSSVGSYLPGPSATVVADLEPFRSRLLAHRLTLAILPTPVTATSALTDTWGLAFSGRERTGSTVAPPTVDLTLPARAEPQAEATPKAAPVLVAPLPRLPAVPTTVDSRVVAPPPPAAVADPPQAAPPPAPGRLVAASFIIRGGRYGTVWAVPLLLFLLGWAVRSVATRDLRSFASLDG